MDEITEEQYPIQTRWIWESALSVIPLMIFLLFFIIFRANIKNIPPNFWIFVVYPFVFIGIQYLRRYFFHYTLGPDFITVKQGIIYRKERHIPYARIQNLVQQQSLADRIFQVTDLIVQDATQGQVLARSSATTIGSSGNSISIPGLSNDDAKVLKEAIIKKMMEHPSADTTSGL